MKFAFISEEKVAFPVVVLCRVLAVSPSGYYASLGRSAVGATRGGTTSLAETASRRPTLASKRRYGSPRVHADLKAAGQRVARKRVARLMRESKLAARTRRRFRTTTDSKHAFPIAPEPARARLHRRRPRIKPGSPTSRSSGPRQGWLYLAVILDLFSRRVVGWATSENVDRHLALAALDMALIQRRPVSGLVHHSDRGSTYASERLPQGPARPEASSAA